MKLLFSACIALTTLLIAGFTPASRNHDLASNTQAPVSRKIQVAILLDVSNSMDGLIEQAKAQLWNMVTTLGKTHCNDNSQPAVEVALYEYGRPANGADKGFVRQLSSFTNDLDSVSTLLFGLKTHGGNEFCGQVIHTSMDELKWDSSPDNYKVIFIAGNEDFLQGTVHYTKACDKAKDKGVIVNTIYCGPYEQGIREHWNLSAECGQGSYTNINQDAKEFTIPTPFDSTLVVLNFKLNSTYVGYGLKGADNVARQKQVDQLNFSAGYNTYSKRTEAKSKGKVYDNSSWDLVDAIRADSTYFSKLDRKTLPDSLKNRSTEELKGFIYEKSKERAAVQTEITKVIAERNKYIAAERSKRTAASTEPTLESAVNKILVEQVKRYKMEIRE